MSHSKLTIGLITAAFALAALPSPATASDAPTISVSYSDLDVGNPAGIATLDRRIRLAIRQLCASHLSGRGAWGRLEHRRCVAFATQDAGQQVEQVVARANDIQFARRTLVTIRDR